jgi:hypothetical protein
MRRWPLSAFRESGLSGSAFCRDTGIPRSTFERWKCEAIRTSGAAAAVRDSACAGDALGVSELAIHPEAGPRLANLFTLLENCRQAGVEPEAYLIDLATTLAGESPRDLDAWLPRV